MVCNSSPEKQPDPRWNQAYTHALETGGDVQAEGGENLSQDSVRLGGRYKETKRKSLSSDCKSNKKVTFLVTQG